jgi:hypothetical protein
VIELSKELCFSLETIQAMFVSCELLGKDFDGDLPAELGVSGLVNFSQAAGSDRR